ncbi:type I-E CRISPR-associated endoribonuclease Cas2e [Oerskovia enterophila]|uniref:type I-E CRISPR-associated endoribonuclease Cas2e n=1 Tax=Oerskovia enterophila TaxID=43678 RepID=UPI003393B323
MIVVVLSVCPEKLRGELTRWLLEISAGVYVGHVPARVRDLLWLRITEDVSRGRAIMVHTARNEQRMTFRVHNHAWETIDHEGLVLMRRQTVESRALAKHVRGAPGNRSARDLTVGPHRDGRDAPAGEPAAKESWADQEVQGKARTWSHAGRRRRYRNAVEQRRLPEGPEAQSQDK